MEQYLAAYENILLSFLGICILLPLFIAVMFEPKRDYSRRIYIFMLIWCAGILCMEALQWMFDGKAVGIEIGIFKIVDFIFYLFLILLCSSWTLYSYYWFNGHQPSRKIRELFSIGPIIEFSMLVVNLFTGFIYTINDKGVYGRQNGFIFFIGFCYLYLINVIVITAICAINKNKKNTKRDIGYFLLFFLFPILGPVLQYMVAEVSVMGISEAIALLTIFVAVQQRTNSEYAIEKAKYIEENERYEKSLEELLSVSSEALGIFYMNLTRNICNTKSGSSEYIKKIIIGNSVDDVFTSIASVITVPSEEEAFKALFNRENLLISYSKQQMQISFCFHRKTDSGESHYIKALLNMLKNPRTGDIEAIAYSVDIDRQEKEEKVIAAITNREYDYIALIDAETKKIHYQYMAQRLNNSVLLKMGDYDQVMKIAITAMKTENDGNPKFEDVSFDTIYKKLQQQKEYVYTFQIADANGLDLQKRITFCYLDDSKKEILFFRNDITEEMRQEREHSEKLQSALQEAQHANAMKSEFLSNVSHDMRTPLNAVIGYTCLAMKSKNLQEVRIYLDKLDRAGKILLSLINDTLDLSKIETGVITLKKAPIRCNEVVNKIISAVQPLIDEKHIHFVFDNSKAVMATINIDALRVQEIFINLLSNAIKFTPEKGQVTLAIECTKIEQNCVYDKITVSDTGCGMSKEFIPKAFEPFSQERLTSTGNVGGSGLGLSIVKKLVEMMGGTIDLQSEIGKGTSVTVELAFERIEDKMTISPVVEKPIVDLQNLKVLLVEDNEMNMEIAKAVLEERDMKVTCAENGQIACDLFAASKPGDFDVILMDIRMPVLNGRDASRKIREMERPDAKTIPIIAMSADAFDDDIKKSRDAGINEHIAKPVDPDHLYKVLASWQSKK